MTLRVISQGVLRISGDRDENPKISLGFLTKPTKIPEPKINFKKPHEEFQSIIPSEVIVGRHYHKSSDCFENPRKNYLNQACQKLLAKFSYPHQKKSQNRKFETTRRSFDHSHYLKHGVPLGVIYIPDSQVNTGYFLLLLSEKKGMPFH